MADKVHVISGGTGCSALILELAATTNDALTCLVRPGERGAGARQADALSNTTSACGVPSSAMRDALERAVVSGDTSSTTE